jgi:hypothetical protein
MGQANVVGGPRHSDGVPVLIEKDAGRDQTETRIAAPESARFDRRKRTSLASISDAPNAKVLSALDMTPYDAASAEQDGKVRRRPQALAQDGRPYLGINV